MTSCHRLRDGRFSRNRLDTTRPIALNRFSRSLSSSCCAMAAPASAKPEMHLRGIGPSRGESRRGGGRSAFASLNLVVLLGSLNILLLDQVHHRCDLLGRDPPPLTFRPSSHDFELEMLVQATGRPTVPEGSGKKGRAQLSRSASAVSPAKSGRGIVEQVEPQ